MAPDRIGVTEGQAQASCHGVADGMYAGYTHTHREANMSAARQWVLIIVGGTLLIVLILIVTNVRTIGSHLVISQFTQNIEAANIPADAKPGIIARVEQIGSMYQQGQIEHDHVVAVGEALANSPILVIGALQYVNQTMLQPSEATAETKQRGQRALRQLGYALDQGLIEYDQVTSMIESITAEGRQGQVALNEQADVAALGQMVERVEQTVAKLDVPESPEPIDLVASFRDLTDRALASVPAGAPE